VVTISRNLFWQQPNHKRLDGSEPSALPRQVARFVLALPSSDKRDVVARQLEPQPEFPATQHSQTGGKSARRRQVCALLDATTHGDKAIYEEVLTNFVEQRTTLLNALACFFRGWTQVTSEQPLANAVIESWKTAPIDLRQPRCCTSLCASDDVPTYKRRWNSAPILLSGRLSDISPVELGSLFDGEFWCYHRQRAIRSSFILKRTLASARRE